jgi:hypothetical protein
VAELVDAPDLGSGILGCAGSIPVLGIFSSSHYLLVALYFLLDGLRLSVAVS